MEIKCCWRLSFRSGLYFRDVEDGGDDEGASEEV